MYLRFITTYKNEMEEQNTGVFQALGFLICSEHVFDYDKEKLNEIRDWFNKELERPVRFNKHSNKNKSNIAISWYKDSAIQHLKKMYQLIPIFDNYGIKIEIVKRQNPDSKVFEDDFQIVTIPHGKEKSKVL